MKSNHEDSIQCYLQLHRSGMSVGGGNAMFYMLHEGKNIYFPVPLHQEKSMSPTTINRQPISFLFKSEPL